MKKIILLAALTLSVNIAMAGAGGGKVKAESPLYDDSGSVVGSVVPVPSACEVVMPQSGKAVYIICDESEE